MSIYIYLKKSYRDIQAVALGNVSEEEKREASWIDIDAEMDEGSVHEMGIEDP
jgi:hypothetical protein